MKDQDDDVEWWLIRDRGISDFGDNELTMRGGSLCEDGGGFSWVKNVLSP